MNAKDEILQRVRKALADVKETDPALDVPVAWRYEQPTAMDDVIGRFVERVEDYKATVVRVGGSEAEIAQAVVDGLTSIEAKDAILPVGLPAAWRSAVEAAGITILSDEPQLTNDQLNAAGAVVTAARVGAAESGTIMLDHADDQGRRALSLVPDAHICVVRTDQVVSDIPEAVGRLQDSVKQQQPITWISGPSATSDIELSRVEGVHGPRTLYVVVAG
ncbi:L-lactate dehydrogenase complex protein LldG [Luteococcus japonicus]|uniref:L-lactate dehydrogenase complex protein LldG n=1 Tax=Luteococcus japonicus TaxID=33984 RepID=A0A3N1ZVY7_9ACTN|nr:LUD domain-containing protein [Luteococcus japonicus]ROR54985.1 L-lactate dehydrogenase complex protein LldG [Luteococcus japonicus]